LCIETGNILETSYDCKSLYSTLFSLFSLPYHVNQISELESVQGRFTKRIVGLRDMPYVDRLKELHKLQLESLETRRLHNDLLFTYKVLFGLASVDWSSIFTFNSASITRGHSYKLFGKHSSPVFL